MAEFGQLAGQHFYCILTIKGTDYNPSNLMYLISREWVFNVLPTIELQFLDDGYLNEVSPLEDGEDIQISVAKHEDDVEVMELTFSMDNYEVGILGDNNKSIVTLTGHLKADDMFTTKTRRFPRQNSEAVLQTISDEAGFNFKNPHKIAPADNMIWYQLGISNFDMIRHVMKRAYIPNDTIFAYANTNVDALSLPVGGLTKSRKSDFVFTSLQSEVDKKEIKICKYDVPSFELNVKNTEDMMMYQYSNRSIHISLHSISFCYNILSC